VDGSMRLGCLPLEVDGYELEGLQREVSSEFTRRTTVVRLHGAGETGAGEDVTYDADEQARLRRGARDHARRRRPVRARAGALEGGLRERG